MRKLVLAAAAAAALVLAGCAGLAGPDRSEPNAPLPARAEPEAPAADPVLAAQIKRADAILAEFTPDMPGAAFLVARQGEVVYERYLGSADLEHDRLVTADSPFNVGSVSKQFTALAIALLAKDGKVRLDADIRTYLPEMPDYGAPILVSDLVHHTSGLRDDLSVALVSGWRFQDLVDQKAMLTLVRSQTELNFPPGTDRAYSNAGYLLMAEIVERVSGMSLRAFAAERIFKPLDMRHTFFADDAGEIVPKRVLSYALGPNGKPQQDKHTHGYYGAAGVWSTVRDLERWSRELMVPKVFDADLIASLKQSGRFRDGRSHGYAFGMYARPRAGRAAFGHGGRINGYRADIMSFPEDDASVIVMTSRPANAQDFSDRLADVFLNDGTGVHPASVEPPTGVLERLQGAWKADWAPLMELRIDRGRLVRRQEGVAPQDQNAVFLADGRFRFDDPLTVFRVSDDGQTISQENGANSNPPVVWRRAERTSFSDPELRSLEGCYRSADLDTTLKLSVTDGVLYREGVRMARIPLALAVRDIFEAPTGTVIRIARDATGRPEAILVSIALGRVRDLPFRRVAC